MLAESEARGLPGASLRSVKFQRGYEGHAFDDVIVTGADGSGGSVTLEVQAKLTLDFTKGDPQFGRAVRQIAQDIAQGGAGALAIAISRTNGKIERPYQQLLQLARKLPSGADLRTALVAERVTNQGMRDFASAFQAQLAAASVEAADETLWNVLRRFQILVFDFESPGALSPLLVEALAKAALPIQHRDRHRDLWSSLVEKSLSYDAEGGEITRDGLRDWLTRERGFVLAPGRDIAAARDRLAKSSEATLCRIDSAIGTIELDRSAYIEAVDAAPSTSRLLEISGASGIGKSAILKTLAEFDKVEGRPLVLNAARTPGGGWLALAQQLGTSASAP
jgi:hypothetical protein